ncbi:hypothetical protein BpHYR1_008462, partial [Brachionus plicatilis]
MPFLAVFFFMEIVLKISQKFCSKVYRFGELKNLIDKSNIAFDDPQDLNYKNPEKKERSKNSQRSRSSSAFFTPPNGLSICHNIIILGDSYMGLSVWLRVKRFYLSTK